MTAPDLVVAPLTPFTPDLQVDETALAREIDYIVDECRATMVVAAGVEAQEYTYLALEARKVLIALTVQLVGGRCPVMAGVSHPSFRTTIELAHFAAGAGAKAIQMLAPLRPFGGPPNDRDLVVYYEAVAKETPLPITLYINPGPGADVSVPATIAIAKIDQVKYVKESSRDLNRVGRLVFEVDRAGSARYFTTMQMLLATLSLGGSGATMPAPACEIARHLIDAFQAGDFRRAMEMQQQFALFPARWMHRGLTPTMKAAMALIGLPVGGMHPPYQGLDESETEALRQYLLTTVLAKRIA